MSLDLGGKVGMAHNKTPYVTHATNGLADVTGATFDSGDLTEAGSLLLQVDTTAGLVNVETFPTSLLDADGNEVLQDGVKLTLVKVSNDTNKLRFADPITGIVYSYADRYSESFSVVFDTASGQRRWVAYV